MFGIPICQSFLRIDSFIKKHILRSTSFIQVIGIPPLLRIHLISDIWDHFGLSFQSFCRLIVLSNGERNHQFSLVIWYCIEGNSWSKGNSIDKKLVGGFHPIISQIGSFPQVGVKIKDVWNHQPENQKLREIQQFNSLKLTMVGPWKMSSS